MNGEAARPTHDDEALLIERAKQRMPTAWVEIYRAYYRKLFLYCYARTTSEATAADLASKVYLEALEGIDGYEYRGRPLLAWLYRIARNVVSDHLRARERETRALERAAATMTPHDPGPAAQVTDRQDVLAALQQLTEDQQQVVALRFYSGCSTSEIAEAMGRSERAVYSLEVRALASLRNLLGPGRMPEDGRWAA
ncbi:MAG: RNA polymerase sigma factor [Dehalococcoidia bacterium]